MIKRIICLSFVVLFGFTAKVCLAKYSGGNGSESNPYRISNAYDMNDIGLHDEDWDKHFVLTNDIDLAQFTGTQFNTIGNSSTSFTGVFDGNGHTISNFTYSSAGMDLVGLFSYVWDAEIKNLGLIDPNVNAGTGGGVGSLAATAHGTVSNCYVQGGSVSGGSEVGGLVGANYGVIRSSFADVNVYGQNKVGGLVGGIGLAPVLVAITVENCYATGNVNGNDNVGGLVGTMSDGVICNSYSTGSVSGAGVNVGGLIGGFWDRGIIGSYWDINMSGQAESGGGRGKTTAEMKAADTFVGWGCSSVWTIDDGNDYPRLVWENKPGELITKQSYGGGTGTAGDPYLIYTAEQFNTIGLVPCSLDKHFKLMADIDLSSFTGTQYNIIGRGFSFEFTGTFDGNNHVISGFSYSGTDENYIGIFGFARGDANIKNLGLTAPDIEGADRDDVGALVGWLISGTIDKCYVEGGCVRGGRWIGGLIGNIKSWNEYANISDCYSTCAVEGTGHSVGGIAGYVNNGLILRCFATGSVEGEKHIGGLVGSNYGSISSSYATGAVHARDRYAGGLAGGNYSGSGEGHILNCYSTGSVVGSYSGGFVGNTSVVSTGCFWDKETSGRSTSDGGATGLMTSEMQTESTFTSAGWDFVGETINGTEDIWTINDGNDYPVLVWPLINFVGWYEVDLADYAFFSDYWQLTNCGDANDCNQVDLDFSDTVDGKDLKILLDRWLTGLQ